MTPTQLNFDEFNSICCTGDIGALNKALEEHRLQEVMLHWRLGIVTAAYRGHLEFVKWCVEVDPACLMESDIAQLIQIAAENGYLDMLKWLAEDFDENFINHGNPDYVFRCTASKGQLEVLKWLLFESKLDVTVGSNDNAALVRATHNRQAATISFLARYLECERLGLSKEEIRVTLSATERSLSRQRI